MIDTSAEAVAKLLDGVTPGPWDAEYDDYGQEIWFGGEGYGTWTVGPCFIGGDGDDPDLARIMDADARFIAAARDLVPALLAERDALRKERDSALGAFDGAQRRHAEADATIAAAEAIIAVAETAEAERDALKRENENLRQIDRNVQAAREHEYERAEAALTEVGRLKAERDKFEAALARACLVGGTTYLIERYTKAEAEVERLKAHPVTVHDAARVPEIAALIDAVMIVRSIDEDDDEVIVKRWPYIKMRAALRAIKDGN